MAKDPAAAKMLADLNEQQQAAVRHGDGPLLIVAGAGTGKTRTLVYRVAHLIRRGVDAQRVLLLTFTRRAAGEMLRRVDGLLRGTRSSGRRRQAASGRRVWGGTFHATAAQLLRMHGRAIGLDPAFTIHDRTDSEDLINVIRTELGLSKTNRRFPKKRTCLAIYSLCVNARASLEDVLAQHYRWCQDEADDLKQLFQGYVDRKEAQSILDYDDLLLFWQGLLANRQAGPRVRERFDHVLVDEYQDTNTVQAEILRLLCPDGKGLTVVGDDAQSIYSFRAATVRNILDFPQQFPGTTTVTLEQNYRSTPQILNLSNQVMAASRERHEKRLFSELARGEKPQLLMCEDEYEQADAVIRQVLTHREAGIDLRKQAVLFRASHHSIALEAELSSKRIPFVKYGGLKFVEAAHVKDLVAFLRLAENPRDTVAGTRVLLLLPGVGPVRARQWMSLVAQGAAPFHAWTEVKPPADSSEIWPRLVELLTQLHGDGGRDVSAQIGQVRKLYEPLLEEKYENPGPRLRDMEQFEQLALRFPDRGTMLADMALDPPTSTEDLAGPPHQDEDYLVLSTIHSAKGLEWSAVYVLHAADGNIPSDMATETAEQIEEERRLFYVALTRAKRCLYVYFPQEYAHARWGKYSDRHSFAQLTRFITEDVKECLDCRVAASLPGDEFSEEGDVGSARKIRSRSRGMWS